MLDTVGFNFGSEVVEGFHDLSDKAEVQSEKNVPVAVSGEEKLVQVAGKEVKTEKFMKKCFGKDLLLLEQDIYVVGKGIECKTRTCIAYFEKDGQRFTMNVGNDVKELGVYELNAKRIFIVVTGEVSDIYIGIGCGDDFRIFQLDDSVNVAIYFETEPFKGRGRYFGCAVRNADDGFRYCNVSPDPRSADLMFDVVECEIFE